MEIPEDPDRARSSGAEPLVTTPLGSLLREGPEEQGGLLLLAEQDVGLGPQAARTNAPLLGACTMASLQRATQSPLDVVWESGGASACSSWLLPSFPALWLEQMTHVSS